MVLNYRPANYTGWPIPALLLCFIYNAKIQKISELRKYFSRYFIEKCKVFWLDNSMLTPIIYEAS